MDKPDLRADMSKVMAPIGLLWYVLLMVQILPGAPREASFIFHDGLVREGSFIELRNDTVFVAIGEIESGVIRSFYKLDFRQISIKGTDSLVNLNESNFIYPEIVAVKDTIPKEIDDVARGSNTVFVQSYPPGGRIYFDDNLMQGVTPTLLSNLPAGKHKIAVRKYLKDVDWWGSEDIEFLTKDTLKINVTLKRPTTNLRVQTIPNRAEIYLDDSASINSFPDFISDTTFMDIRPSEKRFVKVFKLGYYDTTVVVKVAPFETTRIDVDLRSVEDPEYLNQQKEFLTARSHRKWGRVVMWASIAPMVVAGAYWYMAENDYQKANDRKAVYESAGFYSAETEKMIQENKDFNTSGDEKILLSVISGASSVGLAALGLVLYF